MTTQEAIEAYAHAALELRNATTHLQKSTEAQEAAKADREICTTQRKDAEASLTAAIEEYAIEGKASIEYIDLAINRFVENCYKKNVADDKSSGAYRVAKKAQEAEWDATEKVHKARRDLFNRILTDSERIALITTAA